MYKSILVPVVAHPTETQLHALDAALEIADKDAKILLFSVVEEIPAYANLHMTANFPQKTMVEVTKHLEEVAKDYDNVEVEVLLGHAGQAVVELAEKRKMDCIVLHSSQPSLGTYFYGSTAAYVARHAHCSVHILR